MINVCIIGSGNVAFHLHQAFTRSKAIEVLQIFSRGPAAIQSADKVRIIDDYKDLTVADIYVIAVSDDAVPGVAKLLPFQDRLVVHTSGSVPLDALADKNRRGVFYPLQTFSKERALDLNKVPVCVEAERPEDLKTLSSLAKSISDNVHFIDSGQRKALHLAAVFVNNFVNHLYQIGSRLCERHNIPFEVLQPLIKETAQKIVSLSPEDAQTGPARRNDQKTIEKHLALLSEEKHKEVYQLLTETIQLHYGRKEL